MERSQARRLSSAVERRDIRYRDAVVTLDINNVFHIRVESIGSNRGGENGTFLGALVCRSFQSFASSTKSPIRYLFRNCTNLSRISKTKQRRFEQNRRNFAPRWTYWTTFEVTFETPSTYPRVFERKQSECRQIKKRIPFFLTGH